MLRPFARGLTQQNSLGGVGGGGGEFSSSHRGHVSMWSLDMYYPAPPKSVLEIPTMKYAVLSVW